jgi:hypothetical protein
MYQTRQPVEKRETNETRWDSDALGRNLRSVM